jgi:hypothetical protein
VYQSQRLLGIFRYGYNHHPTSNIEIIISQGFPDKQKQSHNHKGWEVPPWLSVVWRARSFSAKKLEQSEPEFMYIPARGWTFTQRAADERLCSKVEEPGVWCLRATAAEKHTTQDKKQSALFFYVFVPPRPPAYETGPGTVWRVFSTVFTGLTPVFSGSTLIEISKVCITNSLHMP